VSLTPHPTQSRSFRRRRLPPRAAVCGSAKTEERTDSGLRFRKSSRRHASSSAAIDSAASFRSNDSTVAASYRLLTSAAPGRAPISNAAAAVSCRRNAADDELYYHPVLSRSALYGHAHLFVLLVVRPFFRVRVCLRLIRRGLSQVGLGSTCTTIRSCSNL